MPQRLLARAQEAYGELLGALVGLDDEALDRCPEAGEWSIREILEHVLAAQRFYLELILKARAAAQPVGRD
ncbi:MAG: DinB family protein [Anaerolineae bacterium]|nr:DinB family protein [Anaerolineae bacterium]